MRRADSGRWHRYPSPQYEVVVDSFDDATQNALIRTDLKETGGNRLFMIRGLTRDAASLALDTHPKRVIYLDGACRGPYMDGKRQIYSLDHHENCIRPITLATSVQALRFARRREIAAEGFSIAGNDPDLDTIFGAWALMHADRIAHDDDVFRKMRPLVTVQGNIDTHGFGYDDFLDLHAEQIREVNRKLRWLRREEDELKKHGRWPTTDFLQYTEQVFADIDDYAFYKNDVQEDVQIEYSDELKLPNGKSIIFAQASSGGVYGVEQELIQKKNNDRCVCIIFHDGRTKWTIKLIGMLPKYDLAPVWKRLTRAELQKKQTLAITDQSLLSTGWGGATNIGGEPRYKNGMAPFLDKDEIIQSTLEELSQQAGC